MKVKRHEVIDSWFDIKQTLFVFDCARDSGDWRHQIRLMRMKSKSKRKRKKIFETDIIIID